MALRVCGVKSGDKILANAYTLAPVPGAIQNVGADPIFVEIDDSYHIDLDDLEKKAKSSKAKKKDWGPLLGEYFQKRKALAAVVIFMDIRHPLKENDWEMIHLCKNYNVPFIPALAKSDKLSNNNIAKAISFVKGKIPESNPIAISSKDKVGFDKLSREILNSIE